MGHMTLPLWVKRLYVLSQYVDEHFPVIGPYIHLIALIWISKAMLLCTPYYRVILLH